MNKLIEIAKANGAESHVIFNKNGIHETGKILLTPDQLRATVEQVCAPLVEAMKNAPIVSMFDDAEKFVTEYEKWRDAVKIPVVIKHERALIGDKHE